MNLKFKSFYNVTKNLNNLLCNLFVSELINWSKRCLSAEAHTQPHLNILVCDDGALEKFPIRSAQHIIHYSLPDKVQAFSKRFITCYGFYEDRLCRKFLFREKDLPRPISLVYFDEHLTDEYIEIFELLLNRTECQLPTFLIETVQVTARKMLVA